MVIIRFLLLLLIVPLVLCADAPKLTVELDQSQYFEANKPVKVSILISHEKGQQIDEKSFTLKGKPLTVERVQEVPLGPKDLISSFKFELPGSPKGLHLLDEVTVKVGGKVLRSVPMSYEVVNPRPQAAPPVPVAPAAAQAVPQAPAAPVQASLKLEQKTDVPDPFYPGKRGTFLYRYVYSGDIEMSKEDLPLMKAEGFLKIGEEEIKDFAENGKSVREIKQTIQALSPGEFSFEKAVIEGKGYSEDGSGRRSYQAEALHAETSPVKIIVKAIPVQNKPASFTGAVGKYTFQTGLQTPKDMHVGDKMLLNITIKGPADTLANVQIPDLCCQPGMSGLFKLSDLPPVSEVKGNEKRFTVEMRPLTSTIKEIPALEFAFFDPEKQDFSIVKSDPIPITVREVEAKVEQSAAEQVKKDYPPPSTKPQALEIGTVAPLTAVDLHNLWFGTWWVLWILPVGAALVFLQWQMKKKAMEADRAVKTKTSNDLFNEALQSPSESSAFYQKMSDALILRLVERGEIDSSNVTPDQLPDSGAAGDVRHLLSKWEKQRFANQGAPLDVQEVKKLFKELS